MDDNKEALPPEINLVRFGKPELLTHKTETKIDQVMINNNSIKTNYI
jgi:hypothetical protein